MELTVPVHQIFMKTFFASCLETRRSPPSLLREIINYLPHEVEFGGPVTFLRQPPEPLTAPQETITLHELYAYGVGGGPYLGALSSETRGNLFVGGRRWADEFLNELFSEVGWLPLKWYEVRKFAEFYLENGDLTTPIRPRQVLSQMTPLDTIIELADEAIRREVDLWKGHFLHSERGTMPEGRAFVMQFNAEQQEV